MCDFNRIAGFLIAAQVSYLASLVSLGVGVANSASIFLAALNIPLMVVIISLAVVAASLVAAAIASLDQCASGSCGSSLASLRRELVQLSLAMGAYALLLTGVAIVAPLPGAGAVALATVLVWAVAATTLFSALVSGRVGAATTAFNECQARNSSSNNKNAATAVVVFSVITIVVILALNAGGFGSGKVPHTLELP